MPQRRFHNYQLEDRIGSDAFGELYEVHHAERPRSFVLRILVPPPAFQSFLNAVRARFEAEASLLERLQSPYTAEVMETGVQDDQLFIVSEPSRGRTLRELLDEEGPLPESRARTITRQALESLREAHDLGLPHGALSPRDVLVETDGGGEDEVSVREYGPAWFFRADGLEGGPELADVHGRAIAAPQYAAPERFRGDPTFAADVYAVGLLMWEMLTGEPAVKATTPADCLEAHLGPDPWRLPDELLLSKETRDIVHKALQRHPRKRFVDASRMLTALNEEAGSSFFDGGLEEDSMIDPNVDSSQTPDLLSFGIEQDLLDSEFDDEPSADYEPDEQLAEQFAAAAAEVNPAPAAPRPDRSAAEIELDESVLADQRSKVRSRERSLSAKTRTQPKDRPRRKSKTGTPLSFVLFVAVGICIAAYIMWGDEPSPQAPAPPTIMVDEQQEEEPVAEPSRFSATEILSATAEAGWESTGGADSSSAAPGVDRHVYGLRRGKERLQMQIFVTQSTADANRMGVETKPPAVSIVLDEKLVRLVPPPNVEPRAAIDLARDLTELRNQTSP